LRTFHNLTFVFLQFSNKNALSSVFVQFKHSVLIKYQIFANKNFCKETMHLSTGNFVPFDKT